MELCRDGIALKIGAPRRIDTEWIGQPLLTHLLNPFVLTWGIRHRYTILFPEHGHVSLDIILGPHVQNALSYVGLSHTSKMGESR